MKQKLLHLTVMGSRQFLCILMVQVLSISILLATDLSAQRISSVKKIDFGIALNNVSISDAFRTIESKTNLRFSYDKHILNEDIRFSYNKKGKVADLLIEISKLAGLHFKQINENIHVQKVSKKATNQLEVFIYDVNVQGTVTSDEGEALPGVSILVKGTTIGTVTDIDGNYSLSVPDDQNTLIFSFIGYKTQEVAINGRSTVDVQLESDIQSLDEVVVVGYGTQKKESITGAVSNVTTEDIEKVPAATTSGLLAGKLPGLSFRKAEGRPGSTARIQIRNMGDPLFIIDGIQKDMGQFNQISPNDIESISILKDASAAIYGSRAANGVVLVTTKSGKLGKAPEVNFNGYYGVQNWTRFPRGVNAYEYQRAIVEGQVNENGTSSITPEELEKWRQGTEPGYESFDWYDFIVQGNAPQSNFNVNVNGGSERTKYYFSATRLDQKAVFGDDFEFNRTNIQSNIESQITDRLKVGIQINGRVETKANPGLPDPDDYWFPRLALMKNRPIEQPYVNGNPNYPSAGLNDQNKNWAFMNYETSGSFRNDWRVAQANLIGEYKIIEGLTAKGMYSYYMADNLENNFEYTYSGYKYDDINDEYIEVTVNDNPYRSRQYNKVLETVMQGQLNFNRTIANDHTVGATLVAERIERNTKRNFIHAVPNNNYLDLIQFDDIDAQGYADQEWDEARVGYVGRVNYQYKRKYYFEFAGRYDASWKFTESNRFGFFPSVSAGWRITEESFFQNLSLNSLNDLKIRASYGELGDDNVYVDGNPLDPFAYVPGYTFGVSKFISEGEAVNGSRDRGLPITNISWYTSKISDVGLDFALFNSKLSGSLDYFYRLRDGLTARKYDVVLPNEFGTGLPAENLNRDAQMGGEIALYYNTNVGELEIGVGGNFSYSRFRHLNTYKPRFQNSWQEYRTSIEDRWASIFWGYEVIGQFKSQEEINDYPVNIDGRGNETLLPGDFIYKDVNNDGRIDGYDERPIGYSAADNGGQGASPILNYGLNFSFKYKGFDLTMDWSGGSMYSYERNWELRIPFQGDGNLSAIHYEDRWHREDPFDPNSPWVAGNNPAFRTPSTTGGLSNYNRASDWWLINVKYIRLRTLELGYTLPASLMDKVGMKRARFFLNTFNLVSFDNLRKYDVDPEVANSNGIQYPQNFLVNVGFNLTF